MVSVTGHAIGTRTGVNRDSNRLGTVTTVQNSNISEWEMQLERRDRIGHSRLTSESESEGHGHWHGSLSTSTTPRPG